MPKQAAFCPEGRMRGSEPAANRTHRRTRTQHVIQQSSKGENTGDEDPRLY